MANLDLHGSASTGVAKRSTDLKNEIPTSPVDLTKSQETEPVNTTYLKSFLQTARVLMGLSNQKTLQRVYVFLEFLVVSIACPIVWIGVQQFEGEAWQFLKHALYWKAVREFTSLYMEYYGAMYGGRPDIVDEDEELVGYVIMLLCATLTGGIAVYKHLH